MYASFSNIDTSIWDEANTALVTLSTLQPKTERLSSDFKELRKMLEVIQQDAISLSFSSVDTSPFDTVNAMQQEVQKCSEGRQTESVQIRNLETEIEDWKNKAKRVYEQEAISLSFSSVDTSPFDTVNAMQQDVQNLGKKYRESLKTESVQIRRLKTQIEDWKKQAKQVYEQEAISLSFSSVDTSSFDTVNAMQQKVQASVERSRELLESNTKLETQKDKAELITRNARNWTRFFQQQAINLSLSNVDTAIFDQPNPLRDANLALQDELGKLMTRLNEALLSSTAEIQTRIIKESEALRSQNTKLETMITSLHDKNELLTKQTKQFEAEKGRLEKDKNIAVENNTKLTQENDEFVDLLITESFPSPAFANLAYSLVEPQR